MRLRKVRSPDFVSRAAAHDKKVKRRLVRVAESAPVTYTVGYTSISGCRSPPPPHKQFVKHLVETRYHKICFFQLYENAKNVVITQIILKIIVIVSRKHYVLF